MAKQKYEVLGPIGKPGKPDHKEGDTIELEDKDAERLLRAGAVKATGEPADEQPPEFDPTNVADDELKGLKRPALEEVAKHEEIEGIGDKNMSELIDAILEKRKG